MATPTSPQAGSEAVMQSAVSGDRMDPLNSGASGLSVQAWLITPKHSAGVFQAPALCITIMPAAH